jgi:hypothetical protein
MYLTRTRPSRLGLAARSKQEQRKARGELLLGHYLGRTAQLVGISQWAGGRNRGYPTTTGRKRANSEPPRRMGYNSGRDTLRTCFPSGTSNPGIQSHQACAKCSGLVSSVYSSECSRYDGASRPVNLQGLLDVGVRVAQLTPFESLVRKHCVKLHLIRNRSSHRIASRVHYRWQGSGVPSHSLICLLCSRQSLLAFCSGIEHGRGPGAAVRATTSGSELQRQR